MTPKLPEWVLKRDGRREPFDADRISEALYAATESVGAPNAFLARELTDGVLHFMGQENEAETIETEQIAETVEKVVRELGQPGVAQAYLQAQRSHALPAENLQRKQATFHYSLDDDPEKSRFRFSEVLGLQRVFGRDLVAAHESGCLWLWGTAGPELFAELTIDAPPNEPAELGWRLAMKQIRDACNRSAGAVVVDGAEWFVAFFGSEWLEGLIAGLDAYAQHAILNLNIATPPAWAQHLGSGPLFTSSGAIDRAALAQVRAAIIQALAERDDTRCSIHWHLQSDDPAALPRSEFLTPFSAGKAAWRSFKFTLDRPRQAVRLQWGLDRDHPAISLRLGISLMDFLEYRGVDGDVAKLIAKLPSLTRMAVSAGVQKRSYLRRHREDLTRGFLVDRARLLIQPWDLDELIEVTLKTRPSKSKLGADLGRQVLQTIHDAAVAAGRTAGLDVHVANFQGVCVDESIESDEPAAAWRAAGTMLDVIDGNVVEVRVANPSLDDLSRHLRFAWRTPCVSQFYFVH